jgi:hypothetical protein
MNRLPNASRIGGLQDAFVWTWFLPLSGMSQHCGRAESASSFQWFLAIISASMTRSIQKLRTLLPTASPVGTPY